jgi:hypothetical protein
MYFERFNDRDALSRESQTKEPIFPEELSELYTDWNVEFNEPSIEYWILLISEETVEIRNRTINGIVYDRNLFMCTFKITVRDYCFLCFI